MNASLKSYHELIYKASRLLSHVRADPMSMSWGYSASTTSPSRLSSCSHATCPSTLVVKPEDWQSDYGIAVDIVCGNKRVAVRYSLPDVAYRICPEVAQQPAGSADQLMVRLQGGVHQEFYWDVQATFLPMIAGPLQARPR
jgi:hypothetical protein